MGGSAHRVNCTNREFIAVHTCCLVFTIFRNHMRLKERTQKKRIKKTKIKKKTCIKEGKCKKIKEKKREKRKRKKNRKEKKRKYRKIIKQKQKNYNM